MLMDLLVQSAPPEFKVRCRLFHLLCLLHQDRRALSPSNFICWYLLHS